MRSQREWSFCTVLQSLPGCVVLNTSPGVCKKHLNHRESPGKLLADVCLKIFWSVTNCYDFGEKDAFISFRSQKYRIKMVFSASRLKSANLYNRFHIIGTMAANDEWCATVAEEAHLQGPLQNKFLFC